MSYTFLLPAGEVSSVECFSDIPAFVLSRLNLTAEKFSSNGSETASCRTSQSGTISEHLTDDPGEDSLISSPEDFPAKASAWPAMEPDLNIQTQDSGTSKPESLARFDPLTSSWKTRQRSLFAGEYESLATLPKWGMIVAGELYPLPTPSGLLELRALITSESASGSLDRMPTPQAQDAKQGGPREHSNAPSLMSRLLQLQKYSIPEQMDPPKQTGAQRVPTPKSEDGQCSGGHREKDDTLYGLICRPKRAPTPAVRDSKGANSEQHCLVTGGGGRKHMDQLANFVRFTTPTCRDAQSHKKVMRGAGSKSKGNEIIEPLACQIQKGQPPGGQLNPSWVEWLMGWPIGWTDLKPLAMDKFQQWCASHGEHSQG